MKGRIALVSVVVLGAVVFVAGRAVSQDEKGGVKMPNPEEMKKAMWAVDKTGSFFFSDRDNPNQMSLLADQFDDQWLAKALQERLAGEVLSLSQIKEFVLVNTPCRLFKKALVILEKKGVLQAVNVPSTRRSGTFTKDDWKFKFA